MPRHPWALHVRRRVLTRQPETRCASWRSLWALSFARHFLAWLKMRTRESTKAAPSVSQQRTYKRRTISLACKQLFGAPPARFSRPSDCVGGGHARRIESSRRETSISLSCLAPHGQESGAESGDRAVLAVICAADYTTPSARILLLTSSRPARLLFDKRGAVGTGQGRVELQGRGLCNVSGETGYPKRAERPCSSLGCADLPARLSMLGLERVIVGVCVPE